MNKDTLVHISKEKKNSARKMNSFESVMMRWMNLELTTQSEVSKKRKKQILYINTYITTNKASGGDGIPVQLFQILKVLHSICQQIWKTQQWPQKWKRSVFIPVSKKGNAKECSNYHTVALVSHASEVTLKILQVRFDSA